MGYGGYLLLSGHDTALVIVSTIWGAVNCLWLGWVLGYLAWYERHQALPAAVPRSALENYQQIVARFGADSSPAIASPK